MLSGRCRDRPDGRSVTSFTGLGDGEARAGLARGCPAEVVHRDGARTFRFIAAAVESSRDGKWVDCRLP